MTFREAIAKADREKLIELAIAHYNPSSPEVFREAFSTELDRLLEIDISDLPENEKLNGILLVYDEVSTEYDLDKGFSKWKHIDCSYYDFDENTTMSIEFSPFRMWLRLPISRKSLDSYPLETIVCELLTDMLFYTSVYDAADRSKPLDADTQDAFEEVASRLRDIENNMADPSNTKFAGDQSALPGVVEPEKSPESLVHDVMKIIYPGLPDVIYDALQTMTTFSALRDASYSIMAYNDALGNEKTELYQPDAKAIEAFDILEAYRLSTGRTMQTTTLLEVL